MATGRVPTTANSPLTAKGDLFGYSTTQARVPVGNNGETIVADSSTSTGLRYQGSITGGKNIIINGGFDIWQRGTSSSVNGGYTTADRWAFDSSNATKSQQTTGAPSGSRYVLRNAFTSASGAYSTAIQYVETNQVVQLWGNTVTASVKLRRSSGMASNLSFFMQKNATVDAGPPTGGWTTISTTTVTNASMPTGTGVTDWFTATITTTIPNDGTANSIRILVATSTEPGNGSYWEMAQCQIELGSTATTFSRAGGTIQGELAACQRYYTRLANVGSATEYWFGSGYAGTSTQAQCILPLTSTMRSSTITLDYSGVRLQDYGAGYAISALIYVSSARNNIVVGATSSGLTANRPLAIDTNTTGYIGISAEL